jgi:hypothetical protein
MLKKGLFIVAAVAMLAMTAQAGEIKLHQWPCTLVPQEITTIPVYIDAGYYIYIKDQGNLRIDLTQVSGTVKNYTGSCTMQVKTNFNVQFSGSCTPLTGYSADAWNVSLSPSTLAPSTSEQPVVVTLNVVNLNLVALPGGVNDVLIANVKIKVVPI